MDKLLLFFTTVIIVCFGLWPAYGTLSGYPRAWIIMCIGIVTFLSGVAALYVLPEQLLSYRDAKISPDTAMKFLALAVFCNCAGNFLFSGILASKSDYIPYYVMIIMAGVPVSAQLSQIHYNKDVQFTNLTIPAIITIIIGICMLMLNNKQIDYLTKKIFHH